MKRLIPALAVVLFPAVCQIEVASTATAAGPHGYSRAVCGVPAPVFARCQAVVATDASGVPLGKSGAPAPASYGPAQFHSAYNLPCRIGGATEQALCSTPATFGGQTIGIVDAFNDPNVESDLGVYDSKYGLPACTRSNGCLTVVDERGRQSLPGTDAGWALEISLDVQIAHETCQTCRILLVEARSANFSDLTAAENTAASLGASEISNSWDALDSASLDATYTSSFNHPGVAVVAAAGDNGAFAEFPATSRYVLAVGGTSLYLNSDGSYNHESVWGFGGSGCSAGEPANSWQEGVSDWKLTGCSSNRAAADVAADADPSTGAAIYDSTPYSGTTGWQTVGGTSLAAPLIAGVIALAGGTGAYANAEQAPYLRFTASNSHDVTTGSNGGCGTIVCNASVGYDGPTGLGTPNGTAGF